MIRRISVLIFTTTVAIVLPLTAAVYVLYRIYPRSMAVYPDAGSGISAYSDTQDGGSSTINYTETDSLLRFEYLLAADVKQSYAGLALYSINADHWDVSKFNRLFVTLKKTGNDHLRLFIKSFIDGFSRPGNYMTLLFSEKDIQTKEDFFDYDLPFKSFSTPEWWYTNNNLPFSDRKKVDLKRITSVELANTASCVPGMVQQVYVKKIEFANRYGIPYFLALAAGIAGYGFLAFLFFSKKTWTVKTSPKDPQYTRLILSNNSEEEYGKVVAFLADAFHESDLTIDKVAKATGVSIYKIPILIKNQTNRSFKEYLNSIRLMEAQRLLSETDRQIIEISFAVGYNNVSHFNRIFKKKNGKTPRQFREQSIDSCNDSGYSRSNIKKRF
ncbi:MAG: helix-turn-helix transcriptional regulator [Chitinispirillaceae bacterium]|nr:helix-turn-helix transcriptional regulator [Chitinispirillaceae bacterium]